MAGFSLCLWTQGAQAQSVFDDLQAMDDAAAQAEADEATQRAIKAAGYEVENHVRRARHYIEEAVADAKNNNSSLACYDLNAAASEYGEAYIAYKKASGQGLTELEDRIAEIHKVERSLGCW
ncbi:hypothetical protein ABAC460_15230 [Asticcacaulis sp. AC460]|nr:hypothetical protein ABAC460_15230 [Asticcacaulis sp. AC460]